jgi:UDP-N-acetylglucosamine acyltransferase
VSSHIAQAVDCLAFRYPYVLVDGIGEMEPGLRLVAYKNVTVNEDFFQGHFPGTPLMPGVLMIEALSQVATLLLLGHGDGMARARTWLRGVDQAKFRRQVVPGDRVRLEVRLARRRARLARVHAEASVGEHVVAEADLLLGIAPSPALVHPSAIVHDGAVLGAGTVVGPHAVIGPHVRIGRNCEIGASAVIDGWTEIGDENRFFPSVSIGLAPQDLKYGGQPTRLVIGSRNVFREFATIHRGTEGGGGVTTIADRNLFMAYAHVAHDCHVGSDTIFGNAATLGGHVTVEDFATISAFSGVHQFCRIGRHAFVGGYSVVTKDAMPFAKSVGNRARIFGLNTVGLVRRGVAPDVVRKLRRAYRYLLVSKLNTTRALVEIEQDPALDCEEVRYLVHFVRTAPRGVTLKRGGRKSDEVSED